MVCCPLYSSSHRYDNPHMNDSPSSIEEKPIEEKRRCIFLVDDNIVSLNTGKTLLQDKYTVVTIPSGDKLLQMLKMLDKIKPDLILLDVEMPGLDGFETIKKVKSNPETAWIPVIFLTGKNEPENESLGLSLGAADYLTKPFSPPLFLKRIQLHMLLISQQKEITLLKETIKAIRDGKNGNTENVDNK